VAGVVIIARRHGKMDEAKEKWMSLIRGGIATNVGVITTIIGNARNVAVGPCEVVSGRTNAFAPNVFKKPKKIRVKLAADFQLWRCHCWRRTIN